ncbi:hypothetical protein NDU88_012508 [Pleurodeles waltl]|uniref:Uncharacterized protein n=1 Tax=Pleurodeles waltl TaxID=8319 RepID=A0AAV7R1N2_PLEWA|nr:hypothetical protein NDU88_012508 [Pleurodeles waltl]
MLARTRVTKTQQNAETGQRFASLATLLSRSTRRNHREAPGRASSALPRSVDVAKRCLSPERPVPRECSRQLTVPATGQEESGAESRFPLTQYEGGDLGNPTGRIPELHRSCPDNEDAHTGNPDIRVPELVKREEGLQEKRAPFTEDAGGGREENERGIEERNDVLTSTASTMTCGINATPTKEEETDGRESRHVLGRTWLYQIALHLKYVLLYPAKLKVFFNGKAKLLGSLEEV